MNICNLIVIGLTVLSMCLAGCTSIRTLEGPANLHKVKLGEPVTVYERDGRVSRIIVSAITNDQIKGHYDRGHGAPLVTIDVADIESVQVERIDPVKSVLAGTGAVVGAAAAAIVGFILLLGMASA